MITLLNTSILTNFGSYEFKEITIEHAQWLVEDADVQSAIGHQSTATIMSTLLKIDVKMNRIKYEQKIGERAIVFKLRGRPEEGSILTMDQIDKIGFDFGILERVA